MAELNEKELSEVSGGFYGPAEIKDEVYVPTVSAGPNTNGLSAADGETTLYPPLPSNPV